MKLLNNLLIGLIIVNIIWLTLIALSGCAVTNKPMPTPAPKFSFVKVVTIDKDGTLKTQFIKQIK